MQQPQFTPSNNLQHNLFDINMLIAKINQTVNRAQQQKYSVNVQNLVTQIDQIENTPQSLYRSRKFGQTIHQLHRKNKLSTVIQQSITNSQMASARLLSFKQIQQMGHFRTSRKIQTQKVIQQQRTDNQRQNQQESNPLNNKKIFGLRKVSGHSTPANKSPINSAGGNFTNFRRNSEQSLGKKIENTKQFIDKNPLSIDRKNYPTRKCIGLKNIICKKDENIPKSKSKQKRGLSVLSKKCLKSEQNCKSHYKGGRKSMTEVNSSEKQQCKQPKITAKKKYVSDFHLEGQKIIQKKKQIKILFNKNNLMDFYTKSRIRK